MGVTQTLVKGFASLNDFEKPQGRKAGPAPHLWPLPGRRAKAAEPAPSRAREPQSGLGYGVRRKP